MEEKRSLQVYYEDDYWKSFHGVSGTVDLTQVPKRSIKIHSLVAPFLKKESACLEIGAGFGYTLNYIKEQTGCSVLGIEPSREGSKNMTDHDIPCFQGSLEQFKDGKKFDVIILSHVFEHFENPRRSIQLLQNLLNAQGILYVEVPNIMQPEWYKNFKNWFSIEHYYYYSLNKLNYFFNESGFQSVYSHQSNSIVSLYKRQGSVNYSYNKEFRRVMLNLKLHEIMYYPSRFVRNILKIVKLA